MDMLYLDVVLVTFYESCISDIAYDVTILPFDSGYFYIMSSPLFMNHMIPWLHVSYGCERGFNLADENLEHDMKSELDWTTDCYDDDDGYYGSSQKQAHISLFLL